LGIMIVLRSRLFRTVPMLRRGGACY
jgi:hypothetical protein